MSGPLPWQYTEAQKDAQLPYLPSALQAAPGRLDALEGSVDGALSRLDAVEGQADALAGRLDAVESQGSALDGRVDALEASQVTELDDLSDVALTSPVSGDNLYHDGTGWKNRTAAAADWLRKAGDAMLGPLQLAASSLGAAGTAALKIASGPLLVTPEAGAIERLVDKLYFTITGNVRKQVVLSDGDLTSGRIPIAYIGGRLLDSAALLFDWATGNIAHIGNWSTGRAGVGTTWASNIGTKLTVGTSLGGFGGSNAVAHFVDNTVNATVNFQNTNVAGFTSFDLFNSAGTKVGTYAWSNASAGLYPNALWFMTRIAGDMILGTNNVERLRLSASGVTIGAAGTALSQVKVYTPTLAPAAVDAADGYLEQTFSVPGLALADTISVNQPAMNAPPHCQLVASRVSAADTLALTFHSISGSRLPPVGVYRIIAFRS